MSLEHDSRAREFFETILAKAPDPLLRIRSTLALADLHTRAGDPRKGLELLDRAESLTAQQPELQPLIEEKRREIRASMSMPAALSDL